MLHNIFRFFLLASIAVISACGGGDSNTPPPASPAALAAPANVKALAGSGQVTLSWDAVTDATSYTVYWNTVSFATTSTETIDAAANTQLVHSMLSKGQTYYYRVTASNSNEESVRSRGASYSQSAWQWSYPLPQGNTMRDSVSNGTIIVAVGDYGSILSSADNGVTWTPQISGTTQTLNSIVWNGSKFVTISYNGTILVSTNGTDWTGVNEESPGHAFVDVVSNGSQFIIISAGGSVHTSINGELWELDRFDLPATLESIIWTDTNYAIVGDGYPINGTPDEDVVFTSTDGITWVANYFGDSISRRLKGIAWDGSQYVAVGEYSDTFTSPDAITWTQHNLPLGQSCTFKGVIWNVQFIAYGGTNGASSAPIFTSPDGITWTPRLLSTDRGVHSVSTNAAGFLAVGYDIHTSDDATTWVEQGTTATDSFVGIAWNGSKFVAASNNSNAYNSADGITWTSSAIGAYSLSDISWSGTNFVVVGTSGEIFTSADGTTWTDVSITANSITAVTSDGAGTLVAVGANSGSSNFGLIQTSSDNGATWTDAAGSLGLGSYWVDVTWSGSKYAAVSSDGTIITSADGINWLKVVDGALNSYLFYGITSKGDGTFIAFEGSGVHVSADNELTWAVHNSSEAYGLSDAEWNGTQYMAIGRGKISTSTDGIAWTSFNTFGGGGVYGIAWDGSQYVIVGEGIVVGGLPN